MHQRLGVLLLVLASCSDFNPLTRTLTEISATDGLAGGANGGGGKLRITRGSSDGLAEVKLTSSNPNVATIEGSLYFDDGALAIEVPWTAVAPGTTIFTATLGKSAAAVSARVVTSVHLAFAEAFDDALQVGAGSFFEISLSATLASDVKLSCASSDDAVVAIPSAVILPAWESFADVAVAALAPGTARITCSDGTSALSLTITVVESLTLTLFTRDARAEKGAGVVIEIGFDALNAADEAVTLTSSDPSVALVTDTLVIGAGEGSLTTTASVLGAGSTTITIAFGAQTRAIVIGGVDAAHVSHVGFEQPTVAMATPVTLEVSLDAALATARTVTLASSDPTVLAVPASLTVLPGEDDHELPLVPAKAGSATITATLGGVSRVTTLNVVAAQSVASLDALGLVAQGRGSLAIMLDAVAGTDATVALGTTNPNILPVPSTVVIGAGALSATVPLMPVAAGAVIVTATLNGVTTPWSFFVGGAATLNQVFGDDDLQWGATTALTVFLSSAVAVDTPLTVTLSDPTVLEALTNPVIVRAGSGVASVLLRAKNKDGVSDVLLKLGASTTATTVSVKELPALSMNGSAPGVSGFRVLSVLSDCTLAAPVTVTLMSSDPAVVQVDPATITLPAGGTRATTTLRGIASGTAVITLTAPIGITAPVPIAINIP
ncbi:MAG: hypothetical protein IT381_01530 [Deltaproteobacteria bacterium]|nr:hypothetical protein [Deltaproteobacteria bacterium]